MTPSGNRRVYVSIFLGDEGQEPPKLEKFFVKFSVKFYTPFYPEQKGQEFALHYSYYY